MSYATKRREPPVHVIVLIAVPGSGDPLLTSAATCVTPRSQGRRAAFLDRPRRGTDMR